METIWIPLRPSGAPRPTAPATDDLDPLAALMIDHDLIDHDLEVRDLEDGALIDDHDLDVHDALVRDEDVVVPAASGARRRHAAAASLETLWLPAAQPRGARS